MTSFIRRGIHHAHAEQRAFLINTPATSVLAAYKGGESLPRAL